MEILNVSTARELWCRKVIKASQHESWGGAQLAWFSETGMRESIIREAAERFVSDNNEPKAIGVLVVRSLTENEKMIDIQSFMYNVMDDIPEHVATTIRRYIREWKADHKRDPYWEIPKNIPEPGLDSMGQLSACLWYCLCHTRARTSERTAALNTLGEYMTWFNNKRMSLHWNQHSLGVITANLTREGTPFDCGYEGVMGTFVPYKAAKETEV